nr:MAG TPA: hypothetical protein [Caudoviricetes sp.]
MKMNTLIFLFPQFLRYTINVATSYRASKTRQYKALTWRHTSISPYLIHSL